MLALLETYPRNRQSLLTAPITLQVWPRSQNVREPSLGNKDLHHERLREHGVVHCL